MPRKKVATRRANHSDPLVMTEASVCMSLFTGDPNGKTCERFVSAEAEFGSEGVFGGGRELRLSVRLGEDATVESVRKIEWLTVDDAKALARCLAHVLGKLPTGERFMKDAGERTPLRLTA